MKFSAAKRKQTLIPVAVLVLIALYLLLLLPLARQAESLKVPLERNWKTLAGALGNSNAVNIDFQALTNQLTETRQAVQELIAVQAKAAARAELSVTARERMALPFQLVDYENERGKQQDDIRKLAAQRQAKLTPAVFDGFPTHTTAVTQPALLWAELELVTGLLHTALYCDIANIHSLNVALVPTNAPPAKGGVAVVEVPLQLEFTAPAPALKRFLQALPLRATELKPAQLPEVSGPKPAFYVDRVVLRKQSPEQPEEVRASLRVVGFIFRPAT